MKSPPKLVLMVLGLAADSKKTFKKSAVSYFLMVFSQCHLTERGIWGPQCKVKPVDKTVFDNFFLHQSCGVICFHIVRGTH